MRTFTFSIGEKTNCRLISCFGTAQLISAYVNPTHTVNRYFLNFKPLAIFFGCTAWFVSDLVGNPKDRFVAAHLSLAKIKPDLCLCKYQSHMM